MWGSQNDILQFTYKGRYNINAGLDVPHSVEEIISLKKLFFRSFEFISSDTFSSAIL